MKLRHLFAAVVIATAGMPAVAGVSAPCKGDPASPQAISLQVDGQAADGLYALPDKPPKGLVVFAHGYGHTVESWRAHLRRTAEHNRVVAVAMNYRGTEIIPPSEPGGRPSSRGWQVAEGAADSIAAARYFQANCPSIDHIVMYGVSMGGNTAGLAAAQSATRTDGSPLFDHLVLIEAATNLVETYHEARLVAQSGNTFARNATADIERQTGGTFEARPEAYLERSVVLRAGDIAASGVRGVILVHGVDDGLVPYNQSREMVGALRAANVPAELYTVLTREEGTEPGTTITGTILGPTGRYESPFAGHASEASETHTVGMAGFDLLAQLFRGAEVQCGEFVIDGATTSRASVRASC